MATTSRYMSTTSPNMSNTSSYMSTTSLNMSNNSSYMLTTSPYMSTTSPYMSTTSPNMATTSPNMATTNPYISTTSPYMATTGSNMATTNSYISTTSPYRSTIGLYMSATHLFLSATIARKIVGFQHHKINGNNVDVSLHPPEPLSNISATVTKGFLEGLQSKNAFLSELKKTGVAVHDRAEVTISGSYYQLLKALECLENFSENKHHKTKRSRHPPKDAGVGIQKSSQATSASMFRREEKSTKPADDDGRYCLDDVTPDILSYIMHVFGQKVKDVESKYNVKLNKNKTHDGSIKFFIESLTSREQLHEATRKTMDLYRQTVSTVIQEHIDCGDDIYRVGDIQMKYPNVFIQIGETGKHVVLYGTKEAVKEAKDACLKLLGMSKDSKDVEHDESTYDDESSTITASKTDIPTVKWESESGARISQSLSGPLSAEINEKNEKLYITTNKRINIKVYRGDLTHEKTDAIVNAANERLAHIGGLAGAILKAAGRTLQTDCDRIIRNQGSLNVSEVLTTDSYRLPCKMIIHAVGPRWYDFHDKSQCKELLKQTFLNCFKEAEINELTSLAIPAFSSGIFGVPKEICSDSLFNALDEFCECKERRGILQEIHVVNIDYDSTAAIKDKFWEKFQPSSYQRRSVYSSEIDRYSSRGGGSDRHMQSWHEGRDISSGYSDKTRTRDGSSHDRGSSTGQYHSQKTYFGSQGSRVTSEHTTRKSTQYESFGSHGNETSPHYDTKTGNQSSGSQGNKGNVGGETSRDSSTSSGGWVIKLIN
ncbi:uncharacterized protein LOC144350404 [Saccoglossus kowalevskii]